MKTITAACVVLGVLAGSASAEPVLENTTPIRTGATYLVDRSDWIAQAGNNSSDGRCLMQPHAQLTVFGMSEEFGYLVRHRTLGDTGGTRCDNDVMLWVPEDYLRSLNGAAEKLQQQADQEARESAEFKRIMNGVCFDQYGTAIVCD